MKCNECRHKETRGANEYCTYHDAYIGWHGCEYGEPKPQTNADRIRAMSDEELARYYAKRIARCYGCEAVTEDDCFECQMDWLKAPVEVDNG